MRYLIISEILYIILLLGSLILSFVSVFMIVRGIIKRNVKQYFIKWGIIFFVLLVIHLSTRTGMIVANTMIGYGKLFKLLRLRLFL